MESIIFTLIPGFSAVLFGLASAISWGAGDFSGGLASKRGNVFSVVIISQAIGALLIFSMAIVFQEPFPARKDLILGAAAGISGAVGLVVFYRGLAQGRMGVVAPITAVVTAGLPLIFSIVVEGLPGTLQIFGFFFAILSVWLVSASVSETRFQLSDLRTPVTAGIGFGLFFILIDRVTTGALFWPLVAARIASLSCLIAVAIMGKQDLNPRPGQLPIIALAGILDVGGNVFFVLAVQAGRLDVAAILASLYPAVTVILANRRLKEQLTTQQWIGLAITILAVILISV